jgi:hypothetical protein
VIITVSVRGLATRLAEGRVVRLAETAQRTAVPTPVVPIAPPVNEPPR